MATARAGTEVEAANLALSHLGQPDIAQLTDSNIRARAARRFYGGALDTCLRMKWWSFAKTWVRPAHDIVDSLGILRTRYPLPPDCLRVRYLQDSWGDVLNDESGAWDIEGGSVDNAGAQVEAVILVTNVSNPLVAYTRRVQDVRVWNPDFLDVFALELASRMALRLGRSRTLSADLKARGETLAEIAAGIDSKEQGTKSITRAPSWITARAGFRRPPWR